LDIFSVSDGVQIGFTVVTAVCMGVCGLFMIAIFWYRAHAVIRASSPLFCELILIGALLSYSSIFALVQNPISTTSCVVAPWLAHLGFSTAFGCLFAKTFRINRILNQAKLKVIILLASDLLYRVGVFQFLVAIYLVVWTAVDIPTPTAEVVGSIQYLVCDGKQSYWPNLILFVEGFSLLYGVKECYAARNNPTLFNESKWIALALYNTTVLGGISLILIKAILPTPDVALIFTAAGILIVTTVIISVLFVPKFHSVYTDVEGKNVHLSFNAGGSRVGGAGDSPQDTATPSHTKSAVDEREREVNRKTTLTGVTTPGPIPLSPVSSPTQNNNNSK